MKRLNPTLDVVFKLLFARNPELLRAMLSAVLAQEISELTVLNPELPGDLSSEKLIRLDIRVVLQTGKRVVVEMQIRVTAELAARVAYYTARDYGQQLRRGEDYGALTPTVTVLWVVEPMFSAQMRLHSIYEMRERVTQHLFSEDLTIHVLQLSKINEGPAEDETFTEQAVRRWARFLTARTEPEFRELAKEDRTMASAEKALEKISQDPAAARLAQDREDALTFYNIGLAMSREEGKAEGKAEGQRAMVVQLCELHGVELTSERRAFLDATDTDLAALFEHLAMKRSWPQ